eukprot:GFYU01027495.1.p1 GENE.GFYU01027495.1~~GFYU01027495.1.p1  ORF type:complete len:377 (-),score=45.68 GFYU01027495.1:7-1137(-)
MPWETTPRGVTPRTTPRQRTLPGKQRTTIGTSNRRNVPFAYPAGEVVGYSTNVRPVKNTYLALEDPAYERPRTATHRANQLSRRPMARPATSGSSRPSTRGSGISHTAESLNEMHLREGLVNNTVNSDVGGRPPLPNTAISTTHRRRDGDTSDSRRQLSPYTPPESVRESKPWVPKDPDPAGRPSVQEETVKELFSGLPPEKRRASLASGQLEQALAGQISPARGPEYISRSDMVNTRKKAWQDQGSKLNSHLVKARKERQKWENNDPYRIIEDTVGPDDDEDEYNSDDSDVLRLAPKNQSKSQQVRCILHHNPTIRSKNTRQNLLHKRYEERLASGKNFMPNNPWPPPPQDFEQWDTQRYRLTAEQIEARKNQKW